MSYVQDKGQEKLDFHHGHNSDSVGLFFEVLTEDKNVNKSQSAESLFHISGLRFIQGMSKEIWSDKFMVRLTTKSILKFQR
jgi:hypothetical protein